MSPAAELRVAHSADLDEATRRAAVMDAVERIIRGAYE